MEGDDPIFDMAGNNNQPPPTDYKALAEQSLALFDDEIGGATIVNRERIVKLARAVLALDAESRKWKDVVESIAPDLGSEEELLKQASTWRDQFHALKAENQWLRAVLKVAYDELTVFKVEARNLKVKQ